MSICPFLVISILNIQSSYYMVPPLTVFLIATDKQSVGRYSETSPNQTPETSIVSCLSLSSL